MTEAEAEELLKGIFTDNERRFLLSHAKFKEAVERAPKDCLLELGDFGMKILLREGHSSRSANVETTAPGACEMNIRRVLAKRDTNVFAREDGTLTENFDEAHSFANREAAIEFCQTHQLINMDLVLRGNQPARDDFRATIC